MNTNPTDPALAENLAELCDIANEIGAEGTWILRGASFAALSFIFDPDQGQDEETLVLEPPHPTILLIRFPASDGNQPGLEAR